jgi:hypothetical protein
MALTGETCHALRNAVRRAVRCGSAAHLFEHKGRPCLHQHSVSQSTHVELGAARLICEGVCSWGNSSQTLARVEHAMHDAAANCYDSNFAAVIG